jgi:rubrerythrin
MSKTAENLKKAFAGESQARNRYTFFAEVAVEEGFKHIEKVFLETADNEKAHARKIAQLFTKYFKEDVKTDAPDALERIGNTAENLMAAAMGERYEAGTMYPEFEKIAKEEGFDEIATFFKEVGEVEEKHRDRYLALHKLVKENSVFKRPKEIYWRCLNCGYIHYGKEVPEECPACKYPQMWYEPYSEEL